MIRERCHRTIVEEVKASVIKADNCVKKKKRSNEHAKKKWHGRKKYMFSLRR